MKKINFKEAKQKKEKKNKIKLRLKKEKPAKIKEPKEKKPKKKKSRKIGYIILSLITFFAIVFIGAVVFFAYYIVKNAPEFDEKLLYEKDSTVIYDSKGDLIATLGMNVNDSGEVEKRIKLTYDQFPEVLIDALVATEDSRFFQHNGVDIARFLKASIGQVLGQSNAGGASTLTMQVSKNALTSTEDSGIAGILRKFTDIYLSVFKIEKKYTKQDIIEMYLNSEFLGNEAYGVEQASKTYFNKSASDLSLPEAALLAGLFQAPSSYDPYVYPEKAEARRNIVLNLMVRHGYISKEEAEIAKQIPVEKMLKSSVFTANPYQGYIDTVIEEVIDKYNINPYKVPLEIYTYLDKGKQNVINALYDGSSGYQFKDEKIQMGIALVENSTGHLIAVGAHRKDAGERGFNYATMIERHPGSTIKPILDYGPAFEYLNWSTATPLFDEETKYSTGGVLNNWDNTNMGLLTAKKALSESRNTTALQAFRATTNEQKWNFSTSLGVIPGNDDGYIQEPSSIGAFDPGLNPVKLAGAYAAFANGGYYTEPHSVQKIIYKDNKKEEEKTYSRERVMKETTAYLITNILFDVTPSSGKVYGTEIATKTGTSSYESSVLRAHGLSSQTAQDSWVATYNPTYTMTYWMGYDEIYDDYTITMGRASTERSKILGYLNPRIFNTGAKFTVPSGIVSRKIELFTIPVALSSEFTPSEMVETHLFIKGTEPTQVSTRYQVPDNPTNINVIEIGQIAKVSWTAAPTPKAVDLQYLTSYYNTGFGAWASKYLQDRLLNIKNMFGEFGYDVYLRTGGNLKYIGWTSDTNYTIDDTRGYEEVVVKSAYEKMKKNASSGISYQLKGSSTTFEIDLLAIKVGSSYYINPTFNKGDQIPDLGLSTIKFIVNSVDVTDSLEPSSMSYTIRDCTTTCKQANEIDNTKKAEYEITYQVEYQGNTYKEKRVVHIK